MGAICESKIIFRSRAMSRRRLAWILLLPSVAALGSSAVHAASRSVAVTQAAPRGVSASCCAIDGVRFRFGELRDILPIAALLLKQKMNPLFLDHERFVVCESAGGGERIGFGQLRKLAEDGAVDASRYDAPPGSADLEADADEDAWDEFAELEVPSGLDSLPWAPGYRKLNENLRLQRA